MNGVHDLGGMHGFGEVIAESGEPVFHHEWERRTFALALATMGARLANVDEFRRSIERMPPGHYLESSYYEHWLFALEGLLLEKGIITGAELDAVMRDGVRSRQSDGLIASAANDDSRLWSNPEADASRPSSAVALRHDPKYKPRFRVGDRVIARNFNPPGHTRSPRYVRGHRGVIRHDWGAFVFPDAHAQGLKAKPQHCYSVEFKARELWGKDFPARELVNVDLWEAYLEPDEAMAAMQVKPQAITTRRAAPRLAAHSTAPKRTARSVPPKAKPRANRKLARTKR
jgi:nitrile hydratase beta subunit